MDSRALLLVGWLSLSSAWAQAPAPGGSRPGTGTEAIPPFLPSPVETVRHILALSAADRAKILAGKKPEHREILARKFAEYDALTPDEREARLQMLQLRHYLPPLLKVARTNRASLLLQIPPADRKLIEDRLTKWDLETPEQQRSFLEYQSAVKEFLNSKTPAFNTNSIRPEEKAHLDQQMAAWNGLSPERRQELQDQFERFFTLSSNRQQQALRALNASEQLLLQKILRLPGDQRARYLAGFTKFTLLSGDERAAFLKAAERWQGMNEQQRSTWRELARQLPPTFPLPPGVMGPPMPPAMRSPPKVPSTASNN